MQLQRGDGWPGMGRVEAAAGAEGLRQLVVSCAGSFNEGAKKRQELRNGNQVELVLPRCWSWGERGSNRNSIVEPRMCTH